MVGPQPNHHQRVRHHDRVDPKGHVAKGSHSTGRPGGMGDILKVQTPVGKKIQIGMKFYGVGGGGGKFTAQVTTVSNKKSEKPAQSSTPLKSKEQMNRLHEFEKHLIVNHYK